LCAVDEPLTRGCDAEQPSAFHSLVFHWSNDLLGETG
jgi:hypothetical protein